MSLPKTDICRLHKIVAGELSGEGCGKTTARIHELASIVELGERKVICTITHYSDLGYLRPMIHDIFEERELKITFPSHGQAQCYDCKIFFVLEDVLTEFLRGFEGSIVEMTHYA